MALRVYILGDAAAYQNYTLAVERAGGIPCFGSRPADCDCLLLPGGGEVGGVEEYETHRQQGEHIQVL